MIWNWEIGFISNFSASFRTSSMKSFHFLVWSFLVVSVEILVASVYVALVLSRLIDSEREYCLLY